jgi:hypothetical protein
MPSGIVAKRHPIVLLDLGKKARPFSVSTAVTRRRRRARCDISLMKGSTPDAKASIDEWAPIWEMTNEVSSRLQSRLQ